MQVFLFREMRKTLFCQKFVKFRKVSPKFRHTRNAKDRKLQSYVTSSISWLAPNIILIEKKISTYSYASDDPCVYEPVFYEMMVGKVYYAFMGVLPSQVHLKDTNPSIFDNFIKLRYRVMRW